MNVLAVSDFIRTLFLILVATPFILLWGAALLERDRTAQRAGGIGVVP